MAVIGYWASWPSGETQGAYWLLLCYAPVIEARVDEPVWLVDWSSTKLRRFVRSSTAAETSSFQNGLIALE